MQKLNGYPGEWSKHAKEMIKWEQNTWSKKDIFLQYWKLLHTYNLSQTERRLNNKAIEISMPEGEGIPKSGHPAVQECPPATALPILRHNMNIMISWNISKALREIFWCLWRASYIHEYPSKKTGRILHILLKSEKDQIGVRAFPLLRSRCKNPSVPRLCDLHMFRFMITFASFFTMVVDIPKMWGWNWLPLILGPCFFWEHP
jgi:hypothetical protein